MDELFPDYPEEGDYTTEDYSHFYQYGKCVVEVPLEDEFSYEDWRPYAKVHLDKEQFFPNVWWISDHGNCHLLTLEDSDVNR